MDENITENTEKIEYARGALDFICGMFRSILDMDEDMDEGMAMTEGNALILNKLHQRIFDAAENLIAADIGEIYGTIGVVSTAVDICRVVLDLETNMNPQLKEMLKTLTEMMTTVIEEKLQ